MDGVFGYLVAVAQRALPCCQLDLRRKSLFGAGRKHHGAISAHAQLEAAEKAGVIVKKADVRRPGRHDITGESSRKKSLAINEGEIVDFARLSSLIRQPGLWIRRRNLGQFMMGNNQFRAQEILLLRLMLRCAQRAPGFEIRKYSQRKVECSRLPCA